MHIQDIIAVDSYAFESGHLSLGKVTDRLDFLVFESSNYEILDITFGTIGSQQPEVFVPADNSDMAGFIGLSALVTLQRGQYSFDQTAIQARNSAF